MVRRFCSILKFCILGMKRRALSRSTPPCAPSSTYPKTWPGSCPFGVVRLIYRVLFQDHVRKFWRMNFAGLQSSQLARKGLRPKPVFFLGVFFLWIGWFCWNSACLHSSRLSQDIAVRPGHGGEPRGAGAATPGLPGAYRTRGARTAEVRNTVYYIRSDVPYIYSI